MNVLSLKDVSFSYRPGREVLKGVSLSVERGEQVALIGANGVGKSTLLKLFVGLLEPQFGFVEVCGMSVERKNIPSVRRAAGAAPKRRGGRILCGCREGWEGWRTRVL
jgi:ABC-type multidrug transport system ATPase subunit